MSDLIAIAREAAIEHVGQVFFAPDPVPPDVQKLYREGGADKGGFIMGFVAGFARAQNEGKLG